MEEQDFATEIDPGANLRPGIIVGGKFALLREIGEGGTGVIYEAEDTWIGRRVALKVLHARAANDPRAVVRFEREARAAARINHPHIVAVHEVGRRSNGSYFIVQELLQGTNLRDHLVEQGRLGIGETLAILVPIMDALVVAHAMKVVHRDIKPDNIFLSISSNGERVPKLIDFGIAKMPVRAERGMPARTTEDQSGTPWYMSPEQAHGIAVDDRTDVWALGAVVFELLSGRSPFEAPTGPMVLARIVSEDPPRLDAIMGGIPRELADIVEHAMARKLDDRYGSMSVMLDAVVAFADREGIPLGVRPPRPLAEALRAGQEIAASDVVIVEGDRGSDPLAVSGENRAGIADEVRWSRPGAEIAGDENDARIDACCVAASEALRINALSDALAHAEDAIVRYGASGETRARLRIVQAIAHRWQGQFARAEACAAEAKSLFTIGSTGWHAAIGHLAIVLGYVGKGATLPALAAELLDLQVSEQNDAHAMAACRFTIVLMRTGAMELAERVFGRAQLAALGPADPEPVVDAWMNLARAELALHAGDPTEYLKLLGSSASGFAEAGDLRNACLQRANIGNAYLQLGAYERAEKLLREALTVGEPMGLSIVTAARSNLGFVLSRLGRHDEAEEVEKAALEECIAQGTTRYEAYSRIVLAEIYAAKGDIAGAEAQARAASRVAAGSPSVQAMALAALANLLLEQGRASEALTPAKEAMDTLELLDGVEEGESFIRLVFVMALDATNRKRSAAERLAGARMRLLERAHGITDLELRRSFMEDVEENRKTLELVASWGISDMW